MSYPTPKLRKYMREHDDKTIILDLGVVVTTANAQREIAHVDIFNALERHKRGDWGDLLRGDAAANDAAIENSEQVLSVYSSNGATFWIITEHDRSVTTILLPSDY